MSGGIYLAGRSYWSCAGWLFDLVLGVLASVVTSQSLAALLRETIASEVGVLDVAALPAAMKEELLRFIEADSYDAVAGELEGTERIDTAEVLSHVRSLVVLARRGS